MTGPTAGVGLRGLAVALPRWRVDRATVAQAWGRRGAPGSRPVCGHDEDALTLAWDAAARLPAGAVDTVLHASTTSPLAERASSAVIARALRLDDSVRTADLAGTVRAGLAAAVQAAASAATGGATLVACADRRDVEPGADLETLLGDAGAAALIGPAGDADVAVLIGAGAVSGDVPETWRLAGDRELRRADPAFAPRRTLPAALGEAIRRALSAAGVEAGGVRHLASGSTDLRSLQAAAAAAGLSEAATAVAAAAGALLGFTGAPAPWLALAAALQGASPGDVVVQALAGEGSADALLWRVGAGVAAWREGADGLPGSLDQLEAIPSYARFLRMRGILPAESAEPYSSMPLVAREEEQDLELNGSECPDCGRFTFPTRRLCEACGSRGLRLRPLGRTGTVVTFTEDHIVPNPEPPTVMAVADIDGGGRFYGQLAVASGVARRGLRVELVLRRLHDAGGWPHYFWKMRPMTHASAATGTGG